MGTISSQFCVTAITDGITVHGSLSSDKSLTQVLMGDTVVNSWKVAANQPTIYLTVLKGEEFTAPYEWTWYYNGEEILPGDSRFKTTENGTPWTITKNGVSVPAIKIIDDLASNSNPDLDTITIAGKIETNGVPVDFNAGIEVKISRLTGHGYSAFFETPDGGDIVSSNQQIRIIPFLYKEFTELQKSEFTVRWYLNYDQEVTNTTPSPNNTYKGSVSYRREGESSATDRWCLFLNEKDVTDITVVRCEFYVAQGGSNVLVYQYMQAVDDKQDPDMIYVMYGNGDIYAGNPASLHRGQSVTFRFWVATAANHLDTVINGRYSQYEVMLLKSDGSRLDPNTGWTVLTSTQKTVGGVTMQAGTISLEGTNLSGGFCTVGFATVSTTAVGGKITGLIRAT